MKMVFTDAGTVSQGDISFAPFEKFGELTLYAENAEGKEQLDRIRDAEAIFCNKTRIGRAEIDAAPRLRYIGLFATGYNNIDLSYAKEQGITVCNAGEYSTEAVAQHTFALILECLSRVGDFNAFVREGGWQRSRFFSIFAYPTAELFGKTLGIVGFGSIGRAVARIGRAFGMNILVYTRTPGGDSDVSFVSFQHLLEHSDVVSVHTPLTPDTAGMFDAHAFASMKKGSLFVNTSRGGVVDETALRDALIVGRPGFAALDVLATEPQSIDCPLIGLPNVIVTPHVAWTPMETRERLMGIVVDNLEHFLRGDPIHVVN